VAKHQQLLAEYKDPCSDDGIYHDARAQQQAQTAINDLSLSLECVNHKYEELIARKPTETESKEHASLKLFRRDQFYHRQKAANDSKLRSDDNTGVSFPLAWTIREATEYKDWVSLTGLTGSLRCLQSRIMSVADINKERHFRDDGRSRVDKYYYICAMGNCNETLCRFEVAIKFHYKKSKY